MNNVENYDDYTVTDKYGNNTYPYPYDRYDDFHSVYTVQMGELIHDKVIDFKDGTWNVQGNGSAIKWYNDEQRERFWNKFEQHYYWREIGELPYKRWKWDLLAKIAELMPKYYLIYMALDDNVDPMQLENEFGKHRNIYSEFPQTMLSGNEDYASNGNDYQYERIKHGNYVELVNRIKDIYTDPDLALLLELDSMFYCVLTSNVNGY